jgi:hypothetical protein
MIIMASGIPDDRGSYVAAVVRRKAEHLRNEGGRGADKPCVRCVHYEPGKWSWLLPFTTRCAHPVFTEYEVDRVSGALIARSRTKPAEARAPGQLCGPDAFLFEEKSKWRRFRKWMASKFGPRGVASEDRPRLDPPRE